MQKSNTSIWYVFGLTAIALILGWGMKTAAEGRTRELAEGGVTASLPDQWLVESASAGPLSGTADPHKVFTAWNPLDPGTRYSVSLLPPGGEADLATTASVRNLQQAQGLTAFRILDQTPVSLKGRDGYRVTFAYVDASDNGAVPVVYQGLDYYFQDGDQVIVVTLETSHDIETAAARFRDFAAGVTLGE